ncbi:uncharacterized protein MYCFIDRAFT_203642 [Pseudocercospora fijiensis CIRAD86]|uniref:serine--tRNA ligase n=1 Tax=Pseudocercospora fijiensis (strain CIRAD86) TaxID=383855 RepID=M2Z0T0_PSEFD|nr:uncharacterized protein MYCFIDRAFT_203642 [Pseudocercospora fijiensis CIRAD86]EME83450.1 hypothetical protein MYCFIDRAFT_203642 [Pseudocercospora fijiensis CIRAD86]
MSAPYVCTGCRRSLLNFQLKNGAYRKYATRPSFAPKPVLDLKHIRQAPGLYEQNCEDRNYKAFSKNSWKILELHEKTAQLQKEAVGLRQRSNAIGKERQQKHDGDGGEGWRGEAKEIKKKLQDFEAREKEMKEEMEKLALELPNLSSVYTPVGEEPTVREEIGTRRPEKSSGKSHVEIGKELDILDFEASATTSGWGWYFLKNEGALLEQALIQYALSVAMKRGWKVLTPPSLVYEHIAHACGFMPRDQNGETQIYEISGEEGHDKPKLVLAGTAEIPFAGSQANKTLSASDLPLKVIGPSRCYRAEAGARGVDTKGLYRVHEFTKVEMFAWTAPPPSPDEDRFGMEEERDQSEQVFEEMLEMQKEILSSLGLHAKVLEMPTSDLGASATRKVDIEAYFPSRRSINDGYGEVTSVSICTDYQSRRLATRFKGQAAKLGYPHTVNGTAMAVPRVLACLIENHYDEVERAVKVPNVLRRFLPGGMEMLASGFNLASINICLEQGLRMIGGTHVRDDGAVVQLGFTKLIEEAGLKSSPDYASVTGLDHEEDEDYEDEDRADEDYYAPGGDDNGECCCGTVHP